MAKFNPKPGHPVTLAPGLKRIVAPNPSPMTFRGTNTYILGTRDLAVIDPGPPDEAHLEAIMSALQGHQRISHVLVTHSHVDHSPLAMVLAQITGTRVHAFGPSTAGRPPLPPGDLGGGEGLDETFMPDVTMKDADVVEGSDWTLRALHTPGHMGNHLCFAWEEGRALFSGDLVMGWATSMVSPPDGAIDQYMASLEKLLQRKDLDDRYHPGHGPEIGDPAARLQELLVHRREREAQILAALADAPGTPESLAARIYTETDPALLPAATRNVFAHLIDLSTRNLVRSDEGVTPSAQFFKL